MGLILARPRGITHEEVRHNSPLLQLQALAAYAWFYFRLYFRRQHGGSLYLAQSEAEPYLKVAVHCANLLAGCGFIPRIALRIPAWLHALKKLHNFDARADDIFKLYHYAWEVYDEFRADQSRAEEARREKIHGRENRYRCATINCGIQATHANGLRRCSGNCPPSVKPYYCSELCHLRVGWPRLGASLVALLITPFRSGLESSPTSLCATHD